MKVIDQYTEFLSPIDGEQMLHQIEVCGRTCYKSESLMTNDSAKTFCRNIIKHDHQCYDEETEVLTQDGWKKWSDVSEKDCFASLNPDNWKIEYLYPTALIKTKYTGDMYYIKSPRVDIKVTPNHKLYVCQTTTQQGRKKERQSFQLMEVPDIINKSHCYYKSSEGLAEDFIYKNNLSEEELSLIGFAIGDGYYDKEKNHLSFHLKKERKIQYLLNLCKNIPNLEVMAHKNNKYNINQCDILNKYYIYNENKEKIIPKNLMFLNITQSKALLDGLINSDGTIDKNGAITYITTSKDLANQIVQLALNAGIAGNIENEGQPQLQRGFGEKPVYKVSLLSKRHLKPEIAKVKTGRAGYSIEHYQGMVYCAELPKYHILYVKRNGKTMWCGNSVLEHASFGVRFVTDRSVTHEVVRHRLAAYAQESQRYCNYSKDKYGNEVTFIKPVYLTVGTTLYDRWYTACENAEAAYFDMLANGAKPEEARAVLPNSTKTELCMTANIREWRHFFKLRTSSAAHPQIRELSIRLLNDCKKQIPILFDDIQPS